MVTDWKAVRETIAKIINEETYNQLPTSLYHYTTATGLIGIIESNEIWATSIHSMNDENEFKLALNIVKNILRPFSSKNLSEQDDPIFLNLQSVSKANICIASFSEAHDQLSQWRAYTGDYGYSIGFKPELLEISANTQRFVLAPCIYDHIKQKAILKALLVPHIEAIQKTGRLDDSLLQKLLMYGPLIKDQSFQEEREWRLVSAPISVAHEQMSYRAGKFTIIPYFHFRLCQDNQPLELSEVTVGPTPHIDQAINTVSNLFTKYGVKDYRISATRTPYRNW